MKIAFYKGTRPMPGGVFNIGVRWKTEGPYSHVEAVFERTALYLDKKFDRYLCASSSFIDGGVRFKEIDLHPDRWDIIEVPVDEAKVRKWFQDNEFYIDEDGVKQRTPYDVRGVMSFVFPVGHTVLGRFCDEAVLEAFGMKDPQSFHVNHLARICEYIGGVWIQKTS